MSKQRVAPLAMLILLFCGVFVLADFGPVRAEEAPLARSPVATLNPTAAGIDWQPQVDHEGLVLTVTGPEGFHLRQEFAPAASPFLGLYDQAGNPLPDGVYKYELTATPRLAGALKQAMAAARELGDTDLEAKLAARLPRGLSQSGVFRVAGGALVTPDQAEEPRPKASGLADLAAKDQVIADDLIVQGSACIGLDCINNENFGFDTVRLKENNLRIKFEDTSTTAGFPTREWQITVNDSGSGGLDKFAVEDITAARVPFTIEGNADANSLYVDTGKRVGIGTNNPVLNFHVKTGNTPAVRLEQDNSSGFTPQTWDIAGNEANFFIRDVTGGSTLPFRIQPGAPSNSIFIAATSGNVGVGTSAPSAALHLSRTAGAFANVLQLTNNSGVGFILDNTTGNDVFISVNNAATAYTVNFDDGDGAEFSLDANGNITGVTSCVNCSAPSDRSLKENFAPVDRAAILEALLGLDVQTWNYKEFSPEERHIGPVSQDFHALFKVGRDVTLNPVDTFGVAVAAIQGLHQAMLAKDVEIAELKMRLAALEKAAQKPPY